MESPRRIGRWNVFAAVFTAILFGTIASAQAVTVNVPTGDPSWFPEGLSGGGTAGIAPTATLDGNGAARITGDRSRFGYNGGTAGFGPPVVANTVFGGNMGNLTNVAAFSFKWTTTQKGGQIASADAPALRLHTFNITTGRAIQFIWEDGEQNVADIQFVNGVGTEGTTYMGDFFGANANRLHVFTSGLGRGLFDGGGSLIGGSNSAQTFASLLSIIDFSNTVITGISVGVGSSVGINYEGFADDVRLALEGGPDVTFNFVAESDDVPEPATILLIGSALAGLGFARRCKTRA